MIKKILIGVGVLLLILAGGAFWVYKQATTVKEEYKISQQVETECLKNKVDVYDYVLINFWATWCAPCIAEMPLLDELGSELQKENIPLIAISNEKNHNRAIEFINKSSYSNFNLCYIEDKTFVSALPTTILIDKKGKVVWSKIGKLDDDVQKIKQSILQQIK